MVLSKFATALLSIAVILVGAFSVIEVWTVDAVAQLAILAAGAVLTFAVPLFDGRWQGLWKTGIAVFSAIVTALVPLLTGMDYSPQAIAVVVLAGLNALATEVGVEMRVSSDRHAA